MDAQEGTSQTVADPTYGTALREIVASLGALVRSELALVKVEAKDTAAHVGKYAGEAALFGALLASSVLPFLAFVVIGLGRLLDENYWLSALVTSVVCACIGGVFAFRAYKRMKAIDISLPRSRRALEWGTDATVAKAKEVKDVLERGIAEIKH